MAVEEHLRRRFRYHHTTTSLMINDWDWFTSGLRTENFFYNTVLPLAKQGGYDMLLIDDGWNNAAGNGTKLLQDGTSRDPITSNTPGIPDMKAFSEHVRAEGLRLGLWYSNSGGGHNRGNDLADPAVIEAKRQLIETMIEEYGLSHQAVDLTEYWQNLDETTYSSPCDNVYRKAVLARNMMNDIVSQHPEYEIHSCRHPSVPPWHPSGPCGHGCPAPHRSASVCARSSAARAARRCAVRGLSPSRANPCKPALRLSARPVPRPSPLSSGLPARRKRCRWSILSDSARADGFLFVKK